MSLQFKPSPPRTEYTYPLPIPVRTLRCYHCEEYQMQVPKKLVLSVGDDNLKSSKFVYKYERRSLLVYTECANCGKESWYPTYYLYDKEKVVSQRIFEE